MVFKYMIANVFKNCMPTWIANLEDKINTIIAI